ncbi:MAG: DUF302 domain-containing protein [Myxococcales bacterium]|nr:DUF302 domain-containing protein [Myxococcales bacterium]MCB9751461.1 DUF302 domain-containing protein [Myxococcales bacterium]
MYGFSINLSTDFDDAKQRVTAALSREGFGVLSEIDVAAAMHKKLGERMRPYTILGACNPPLAFKAVTAEPDIGLLLPCNVLVRGEEDGTTTVAFMDPHAVLGLVQRDDIGALADDVKARLLRVRDALSV